MGVVSKRVKALDCKCDYKESRGTEKEWYGFEFCKCTARVKKGRFGIADEPGGKVYNISSIYLKPSQVKS